MTVPVGAALLPCALGSAPYGARRDPQTEKRSDVVGRGGATALGAASPPWRKRGPGAARLAASPFSTSPASRAPLPCGGTREAVHQFVAVLEAGGVLIVKAA
jgi:hypothetical protein